MVSSKCENIESIDDCVVIPENAAEILLGDLNIIDNRRAKIAYLPGPGDVFGTFKFWQRGNYDPRVPVIAYSTQFYTLIKKLNAEALIFNEQNHNRFEDDQFQFISLSRKRGKNKYSYAFYNFCYSIKVLYSLKQFKPDIVILSTDLPHVLLSILPKKWKLILSAHNTYWNMGNKPQNLKSKLKHSYLSHGLKRLSGAVCTSYECARQNAELQVRRSALTVEIPQLLENTKLQDASTNRETASVEKIFYLGRIETSKGIFDLMTVFEELSKKHPNLQLFYAGSGSCSNELEKKIKKTKANIIFLGQLSGTEVHDTLQTIDLLVCPTRSSFNEGLALVVVEAAVHTVPSIVSSIVPAKELFESACFEYEVDNLNSLRDVLSEVITLDEKFMQIKGRLREQTKQFYNREKSWGSQLFLTMLTPTTKNGANE